MKHKHHDLIVQWAKDTSQNVWAYMSLNETGWRQIDNPAWVEDMHYKIQEEEPTEPPVKKVSFFDGGIEFDSGDYIIRQYRYKLNSGWCYELSFSVLDLNGDDDLEAALKELIETRLKPQQDT